MPERFLQGKMQWYQESDPFVSSMYQEKITRKGKAKHGAQVENLCNAVTFAQTVEELTCRDRKIDVSVVYHTLTSPTATGYAITASNPIWPPDQERERRYGPERGSLPRRRCVGGGG